MTLEPQARTACRLAFQRKLEKLSRPTAFVSRFWLLLSAAALSLAACAPAAVPSSTGPESTPSPAATGKLGEPSSEIVGGIALGSPAKAVEELLGPPDSKGDIVEMGATGDFESEWTWKEKGVHVRMAAATATGEQKVASLTVEAPSKLVTSRGVGIGTTRKEVETIYRAFLGTGRQPGEPDTTSATQLIIGSIYGGTFFTFADGKVSAIFVGAGAE